MDENNSLKKTTKTIILQVIVSLCLIILIGSMLRNIGIAKQKIIDNENELKDVNAKLEVLDINIIENKLMIDDTRYGLAEAWLFLQGNETRNKVDKFYKDNLKFSSCPKEQVDVKIRRNWYDEPVEPFRVMIMEYTTGNIVVYKDGTVKCYPRTIENMNPDNISCEDLCQ